MASAAVAVTDAVTSDTNGSGSSDGVSGAVVAGIAAAVVVFVSMCIVAVVFRRRRHARTGFMPRFTSTNNHEQPLTRRAQALTAELHRLLLHRVQAQFVIGYRQLIPGGVASFEAYQQKITNEIEVDGSAIRFGVEIGEGHYGTVYHGQLKTDKQAPPHCTQQHSVGASSKGGGKRNTRLAVAVKVPKFHAGDIYRTDAADRELVVKQNAALLLEAFVMHGLRHQYIVSILAVSARTDPVMLCEFSTASMRFHGVLT